MLLSVVSVFQKFWLEFVFIVIILCCRIHCSRKSQLHWMVASSSASNASIYCR